MLQTIVALFKLSNKRWLTPAELEERYDLCESTMAKYRMQKKVPYSKLGTKIIRYDSLKIDKWLEDHEVIGFENEG